MKFKNNGGFTLVELIVVIAILAILAGVAVPAYSGYVAKANEAADLQLMSAVNQAFGAAVMENDGVLDNIQEAKLNVEGAMSSWEVVTITMKPATNATNATTTLDKSAVTASMLRYLAGNEGATFKVYKSLTFKDGAMTPSTNFNVSLGEGLGYITLSPEGLAALAGSTFTQDMTVQELLDKVDATTDLAASMADHPLMYQLMGDPTFQQSAALAMGVRVEDLEATMGTMAGQMMELNPGMTEDEALAQLSAHAAVMYAAQSSASMTPSDLIAGLQSDSFVEDFRSDLASSQTASAMSSATMAYGMFTAYVAQSGRTDLSTDDPSAVMDNLDDEGFQEYLASAQGTADATAYLSALEMITSSTGDTAAVTHLMLTGFNNEELVRLLEGQLGQGK